MKKLIIPFLLVLLVLLLRVSKVRAASGLVSSASLNREKNPNVISVRNNNPGNIRVSGVKWKGKLPANGSPFERFDSWVMGLRAMILNARTWYGRGDRSISMLVSRWAPPTENNTSEYVSFVAKSTGISENSAFNWEYNTVFKILRAMAHMEAGFDVVSEFEFKQAWAKL